MDDEEIGARVVRAAVDVHRRLGPGLLEKTYRLALGWRLEELGLEVASEHPVSVWWGEKSIDAAYRVDLLVQGRVVVECKATLLDNEVYRRQVLTYLRHTDLRLGFLLNFGGRYMRDGITRIVNTPGSQRPWRYTR